MNEQLIESLAAPFDIHQQPGRQAATIGTIIPAGIDSPGIPIAAIQDLIPGQSLSISNASADDIEIELEGHAQPIPCGQIRPIGPFRIDHRILAIRTIKDSRQIGSIQTISLAFGYSEDGSTIDSPGEAIWEWDGSQIQRIEIRSQAV